MVELIGNESKTNKRCLQIWLAIFITSTVCLSGILIWKEKFEPIKFIGDQFLDTFDLLEAITERFKGFFISPEELPNLELLYDDMINNYTDAPVEPGEETCSFGCPKAPNIRKREVHNDVYRGHIDYQLLQRGKRAVTRYHGCCRSTSNLVALTRVWSVTSGSDRTVLQFDNRKQYFPYHTCTGSAACSGCTCVLVDTFYTAIVLKEGVTKAKRLKDVEITLAKLPGHCICLNM